MTTDPPAAPPAKGFQTFLLLWASQGVSALGSSVAWFSLTVYLAQTLSPLPAQRADLALGLSLLGISGALPALLAAPVAGIWADRADRRLTMLACDLLSGALTLSTALLMLSGPLPLWGLVTVSALLSLLGSVHGSAFDTSYGALVGPDGLPRANGMMQTLWGLSGLLAPSLAALLTLTPGGVPLSLAADGLSFWLAAAVLWRLRFPPVAQAQGEPQSRAFRQELTFGWRYILARPPLLMLLLTFAAVNFSYSPLQVFDTLLLKGRLSADLSAHGLSFAAGLALLTTLTALGGVGGGVLVSVWGGLKRRRVLGVLFPVLLGGAALAGLGLSSGLVVAGGSLLVLAFTGPVMNAHSQAIWQAQVPAGMQGRVFSVRRLIAQISSPVSVALAGLLAARFPVSALLLSLALLVVAVALVQLLNPSLRRVEDREYLERLALGVQAGESVQ